MSRNVTIILRQISRSQYSTGNSPKKILFLPNFSFESQETHQRVRAHIKVGETETQKQNKVFIAPENFNFILKLWKGKMRVSTSNRKKN